MREIDAPEDCDSCLPDIVDVGAEILHSHVTLSTVYDFLKQLANVLAAVPVTNILVVPVLVLVIVLVRVPVVLLLLLLPVLVLKWL